MCPPIGHGVALVLGPSHDDGEDGAVGHQKDAEGDAEHGDEMSPEEHAKAIDDAADEMFDALKSGNKDHFRMAMKAYCDLHAVEPEGDGDGEDGEGMDEDDGEDEDDLRL